MFCWAGVEKKGLESSSRVICSFLAVAVLLVNPCTSLFGVPIWMLVIYIIGLAQAHDTTSGKAAIAVLAPMLFAVCCAVAVVAMIIGIGAGSGW